MRNISIIVVSILLSLSIIGPSIVALVSHNSPELEILVDLGEEDNKKEGEKELDKKHSFFNSYALAAHGMLEEHTSNNFNYTLNLYSLSQEIVSPPPKQSV